MAFPTIPTVAAGRVVVGNQADTTATRTFPAFSGLTGMAAGDLLIAVIVGYQSSTVPAFSGWSSGFTEFTDQGTSTTLSIGAAYKRTTGSETGSLTVTQAGTITGHASMILMAIPRANVTAPEAGTIANGTTAAADPGAFDPAGWAAEDTLWIAVGASGMTSGTGAWAGVSAAPTNYTNYVDTNTTDNSTVGQTELAVAFRQLNAASEDVGTFTVDGSNAKNSALLIAVRPVSVVEKSHTLDALTQTTSTLTHTLDGRVQQTFSTTHTVNGKLQQSFTRTHTLDGVLSGGATVTKTHTIDGRVKGWEPPFNVTATAISTSEIDVAFEVIPTATGYDIERDGVIIENEWTGTPSGGRLTYHDTGLSPATSYDYRVRAVR